jgi:phosphoserine phosphatase
MNHYPWHLSHPVNAIIFDCDGTLCQVEGIDEIAKQNGKYHLVEEMTANAMNTTGVNADLYEKRLELVTPQRDQLHALGHHYYEQRVPDAHEIIQTFKRLNKSVFIVSAGLYPAVKIFGEKLEVPEKNIFAVDVHFDEHGNYRGFEKHSPLIHAHKGKREIVTQLKEQHPHIIHIGDGANDIVTYDLVTRFVGYGGVSYRKKVAERCEYYVNTLSLATFLPLALTREEYFLLDPHEKELYEKGLAAIQQGGVTLQNITPDTIFTEPLL